MSSLYRIKENMNNYTETEKKIAQYILENKDKVINYSSQHFAQEIDSSAAAIVRFSKKIGYNGFTHLKVELAKDRSEMEDTSFEKLINEEDSIETMIRKSHYVNHRTFDNTYKLINPMILGEAIEKIRGARRIYLFGIGGSSVVANDLSQKFVRIDREVLYFDDFHLGMSSLTHANNQDVIISFSYSGITHEIVIAQRLAAEKGVTTIAITQVGRNELAKLSDYVINIPKEESELRLGSIASRFSMFAISDLLYLGVAKVDIEKTRSKLLESRKNVKLIRENQ
ncbi:MurR/RpiR family transcriptional regulator [Erysipelothrix sp. HDW6C]|uniref:MurR/RpiR family transcriptional regulator n=1 Tax=Erysipelothrix sp. HDW6C TaxID=2714930 RepID=UPI0014088FF0|nr:MurR/RpiR family transcriptional regulator [Erysipelothrix sp. HDW6C]QIK70020.1 MurR/RpiR family transcriptional regulator [Erysipelothrix sp. HDW6C]